MKRIEAVVVSERDVGIMVDEKRQHVVPLLGNSIVQRCVSLRILEHKVIKIWNESSSKRYKSVIFIYSLSSSFVSLLVKKMTSSTIRFNPRPIITTQRSYTSCRYGSSSICTQRHGIAKNVSPFLHDRDWLAKPLLGRERPQQQAQDARYGAQHPGSQ